VEQTRWVAERIALTIKAFPAGHPGIGRIDEYGAQMVLVDADSPGSGEVFDWRLAEGVVDPARLIVSGGLKAENVADAVAHLHPAGVDVSSGVESAPGRKDPVKVRAFVAAARAAAGEEMSLDGAEPFGPDDGPGGTDRPFDWREEEG
jgi:phosphoribosylanthranilate isomerase